VQDIEAISPRIRTSAKLALTIVVISAAMWFAKTALPTTRYYMVDELLEAGELSRWGSSKLKVHGWVLPGSITKVSNLWTFVLHKNGKQLRVFSTGPMPDTFKDQSEVIAIGTVEPSEIDDDMPYVINANEVLAKCSTKYEGHTPNKNLKYE
jgi:cytochrome c-type biogenesis protein CcmE